jgi:uncharacterized protein Usg
MTLALQLQGYRPTLVEITYYLPDFPNILQQFILQKLDISPKFPVIKKFLGFWEQNIEARIYSVRVASVGFIQPPRARMVGTEFRLH